MAIQAGIGEKDLLLAEELATEAGTDAKIATFVRVSSVRRWQRWSVERKINHARRTMPGNNTAYIIWSITIVDINATFIYPAREAARRHVDGVGHG